MNLSYAGAYLIRWQVRLSKPTRRRTKTARRERNKKSQVERMELATAKLRHWETAKADWLLLVDQSWLFRRNNRVSFGQAHTETTLASTDDTHTVNSSTQG